MRRGHFSIYCMGLAVFAGLTASAWAYTYVVKKGDVLSRVVHELVPGQVWGKHGSIKKVIALNPHIKNPDIIFPGDKIRIEAVDNIVSEETNTDSPALVERKPAEAEQTEVKVVPTPVSADNPKEVALDSSGVEKNTPFMRRAVVALTPYYSLTALTVEDRTTGSDSTVASKYSTGAFVSYSQAWTETVKSFVGLSLGVISFEKSTDSSKTINDDKKFLSGFGLGVSFNVSNRFNLELSGSYQKELFVRPSSTQGVTIDAVNVPSLGGKISYDLVKLDSFVFGVSSSLYIKGPTKTDGYNVKLGAQYGAIIYLKQSSGGTGQESNFQTELGFTRRSQDSSITRQTQTDITLGLRFFFPVGSKEKGGQAL